MKQFSLFSPSTRLHLCAQVSKAYSKTWSYREDALLAVYKQMQELPVRDKEEAKTMMRAAIFLVKRGIDDKVYAVSHVVLWTSGGNVVFVCVCVCVCFALGRGRGGCLFSPSLLEHLLHGQTGLTVAASCPINCDGYLREVLDRGFHDFTHGK